MYDVSRDDLRFLMVKQITATNETATSARLILVQHWFEELKRRVPTNDARARAGLYRTASERLRPSTSPTLACGQIRGVIKTIDSGHYR